MLVLRRIWPLKRCNTRTLLTTSVSMDYPARKSQPAFPNNVRTSYLTSFPPTLGIRHTLDVDSTETHLSLDVDHPSPTMDASESRSRFLDTLRTIVQRNKLAEPGHQIDMVRLKGDPVEPDVWNALDGLRPRHVELWSGEMEQCDMTTLDQLRTAWPVECLIIVGACGEHLTSTHFETVTSLILHYTCSLNITLPHNNTSLRHLTIVENDAIDTFIKLRIETCLTNDVQTLKLYSTHGNDFAHSYEPEDFFQALSKCHTVQSLELALADFDGERLGEDYLAGLPPHLPPNIHHLRFRGPPYIAADISMWMQCATNPTWLPNLRTVAFHLDVSEHRSAVTSSRLTIKTEPAVQQLLDALVAERPSLRIVDSDLTI